MKWHARSSRCDGRTRSARMSKVDASLERYQSRVKRSDLEEVFIWTDFGFPRWKGTFRSLIDFKGSNLGRA